MSHTESVERYDEETLLAGVPLLRAFMECSKGLQVHAKKMVNALCDPELDDEERNLAAITLSEILTASQKDSTDLAEMDLECDEAAAVLNVMNAEEETFANRLQATMEERGLTQTAFAEMVGVSQPAIAQMLKRECRPQKRTIKKIAKALGVAPVELWPAFADPE